MFIVSLTYVATLEDVDKHLDTHIKFLDNQFELGHFVASGRKVPRRGGIILAKMSSKSALLEVLEQDPFKIHKLANYDISEFVLSKTSEALNFLKE